MKYSDMETPLQELFETICADQPIGLKYHREISITKDIDQIAVTKHVIRVHPDLVIGADLVALVLRMYSMCRQFDTLKTKDHINRVNKEITATRKHLEYLYRLDASACLRFLRDYIKEKE